MKDLQYKGRQTALPTVRLVAFDRLFESRYSAPRVLNLGLLLTRC